MSRPLSRSLLSLLMLWQLLASVIAHPLDIAMHVAVAVAVAGKSMVMSEHCEHAAQDVTDRHVTNHQGEYSSQGHVGCGSKCHCPCAGTPALGMSLPLVSASTPESPTILSSHITPRAPLLANLLRPPIS